MNIKVKLSIILFSIVIILSFSLINILNNNFITIYEHQTKKSTQTLLNSIYENIVIAMYSGLKDEIRSSLNVIKTNHNIKDLQLYPADNTICLFGLTEKKVPKEVEEAFKNKQEKTIQTDDIVRIIKPILAQTECLKCHTNIKKDEIVGILDLSYDLSDVKNDINEFSKYTLFYTIIIGLSCLGLVIFFLKTLIFDRLEKFKHILKDLIKDDEHPHVAKIEYVNENDEIGKISKLFNDYIEKIEDKLHKKKIQELNESVDKALDIKLNEMISLIPNPAVIVNKDSILIHHNDEFLDIFDEYIDQEIYKDIIDDNLNISKIFCSEDIDSMIDFKDEIIEFNKGRKEVSINSASFCEEYIINIKKFDNNDYLIIFTRVDNA